MQKPVMNHVASVAMACLLFAGCVPKAELEVARADLAEAQQRIEDLQRHRVPRTELEAARSSLRSADERIATLERELQTARAEMAERHGMVPVDGQTDTSVTKAPAQTAVTGLAKGTYELSNSTFVYSPDALLNFGSNVQISSPTGLMVSDTEQRIVGGDLSIKAKSVVLETTDGILTAEPDGSVKFTGNTLMMKFGEAKQASQNNPPQSGPSDDNPAAAPVAGETHSP